MPSAQQPTKPGATIRLLDRGPGMTIELRDDGGDRITFPHRSGAWSAFDKKAIRSMGLDVKEVRSRVHVLLAEWEAMTPQDRFVRAYEEACAYRSWVRAQREMAVLRYADALRAPASTAWQEQPEHLDHVLQQWSEREERAESAVYQLVTTGWLILDYCVMNKLLRG